MLLVECVEISVMVLLRLMNGTLHGAEHRPRRTVHICLSCHGQVLAFIKWCWPRFAPFFFLGTIASTMTCFLLVTFPCRKNSFHIILNSVRVAKIQDEKTMNHIGPGFYHDSKSAFTNTACFTTFRRTVSFCCVPIRNVSERFSISMRCAHRAVT